MTPKVKIVIAAINTACLIVTLLVPSDITPLILLTTITSAITWAFVTQEKSAGDKRGLIIYITGACILAVVCIVLGITSSISKVEAGKYVVKFDSLIAGLGGVEFNYILFAIPMFICISVLMVVEVIASIEAEGLFRKGDIPIAVRISRSAFGA